MIHTGVASTGRRPSARRNLLPRSDTSTMDVVDALRDHHLETALQLRVAGLLESRERRVAVQVHLALQRSASAFGARFPIQRPATEQVLLQRDAAITRRGAAAGRGLHVEVHEGPTNSGTGIVTREGTGHEREGARAA